MAMNSTDDKATDLNFIGLSVRIFNYDDPFKLDDTENPSSSV